MTKIARGYGILAACLAVGAQSQARDIRIMGSGLSTCSLWQALREQRPADPMTMLFNDWIMGFISGAAEASDINLMQDARDADEVLAWVAFYCTGHPHERVEAAAAAYVIAHRR